MMNPDQTIQVLREALNLSPDNIVLRQHLADTLMTKGQPKEAADEFRLALAKDPGNLNLKLGLAQAFYRQGKNSEALVLVEDLLKRSEKPGKVHLLYTRLLLGGGEVENAVRHYHQAIEADPSLADTLAIGLVELGMLERINNLHPDLILDAVHSAYVLEIDLWPLDSSACILR